jgi:deoxycytidine triphosphate deaminase
MSLIPFITKGPKKTIVQDYEEFALDGDKVLLRNLDPDQLKDDLETNASYDLRIGAMYRDHRDIKASSLDKDGEIIIHPQHAVIIESEEFVHLPKSRFGYILPKVSLLQKGLSNTSSKIDPGYPGKLLITVFNLGQKTATLRRLEKFCSMHFIDIQETDLLIEYKKDSKTIKIGEKYHWFRSLRDLLQRNLPLLTTILIIITGILLFFNIKNTSNVRELMKLQNSQTTAEPAESNSSANTKK